MPTQTTPIATVKLPKPLYERVEERARATGHTVDEQAAELLSNALAADEAREAALLADARAERETLSVPFLTEADLQRMKRWGRE